jgi:hypothetical protein
MKVFAELLEPLEPLPALVMVDTGDGGVLLDV